MVGWAADDDLVREGAREDTLGAVIVAATSVPVSVSVSVSDYLFFIFV